MQNGMIHGSFFPLASNRVDIDIVGIKGNVRLESAYNYTADMRQITQQPKTRWSVVHRPMILHMPPAFLTHRPQLAATPVVFTKLRCTVALWSRSSFSFLMSLSGVSTLRRFFNFAHSVATGLCL